MFSARKLTYSALLIALSVILTRFLSIQTPILRIGFGGLPILLAGLAFGPAWGFLCGALADLVGFFSFAQGSFFPGFTLTAGLTGAIAPLLLSERRLSSSYGLLFLSVGVSQVITSLVLDTYWITLLTGKAAGVLLPVRVLNQVVTIPLLASLTFGLRKALPRLVE
jgi:ECF transporter S component (folate family)